MNISETFVEWSEGQRGAARAALRQAIDDDEYRDFQTNDLQADCILECVWNAVCHSQRG